jgi:hypothetical protein
MVQWTISRDERPSASEGRVRPPIRLRHSCFVVLVENITPASARSRNGGAGGIRTLDTALQPYNGLANRRLQPLGHSSIQNFSLRDEAEGIYCLPAFAGGAATASSGSQPERR